MKRAMTEAEADQLRAMMAARGARPADEVWGALVFALGIGPLVYGGLAVGIVALGAAALGLSGVMFPVGLGIGGAVWLGMAASGLRWVQAAARSRAADVAVMQADLDQGVVLDEAQAVLGVKRLREPEHGMVFVFLALASGRVFVLYDEGEPPVAPLATLHLATFPASKRRVWSFSGAPLALAEPGLMGLGPERWPDDEGWCRVKWESIERHFGG